MWLIRSNFTSVNLWMEESEQGKIHTSVPLYCIFSLTGGKKRLGERFVIKYMFSSPHVETLQFHVLCVFGCRLQYSIQSGSFKGWNSLWGKYSRGVQTMSVVYRHISTTEVKVVWSNTLMPVCLHWISTECTHFFFFRSLSHGVIFQYLCTVNQMDKYCVLRKS